MKTANILSALSALPALLLVWTLQAPAYADPICHWGGETVSLTLVMAEGSTPVPIEVETTNFNQHFIPQDESTRAGLLLRMQATDYRPWPQDLRAHQSEGPLLSFLVAKFLSFDIIVERLTSTFAGYRLTDNVNWNEQPGPYGLSRLWLLHRRARRDGAV